MIISLPPLPLSNYRSPSKPLTLVSSNSIKKSSSPITNFLLRSIAGALALSLVSSPPLPSLAITTKPLDDLSSVPTSSELCVEEELIAEDKPSESITNEELVEEAWEVVNESYIGGDVGNRPWNSQLWTQRKEYILNGNNLRTRSRAHDVIQKMLASLGDPYTRFLSPSEFSKMARYDVTGIGINLREIPDINGAVKLKVLGIILDGPAHSAGVRQGDELLSVNGVDVKGKSAFDVSTMLQGPKETFVMLEVKHGNCGQTQSIKVQRQPVARSPVYYRLEKKDDENVSVGYINIKEFNALATKDLIIALRKLQQAGASYFVLDLRDNLGGLVQAHPNTPHSLRNRYFARFDDYVMVVGSHGATGKGASGLGVDGVDDIRFDNILEDDIIMESAPRPMNEPMSIPPATTSSCKRCKSNGATASSYAANQDLLLNEYVRMNNSLDTSATEVKMMRTRMKPWLDAVNSTSGFTCAQRWNVINDSTISQDSKTNFVRMNEKERCMFLKWILGLDMDDGATIGSDDGATIGSDDETQNIDGHNDFF